jgi:hypothetical protein
LFLLKEVVKRGELIMPLLENKEGPGEQILSPSCENEQGIAKALNVREGEKIRFKGIERDSQCS